MYCKYCGSPLKDGESCQCEMSQNADASESTKTVSADKIVAAISTIPILNKINFKMMIQKLQTDKNFMLRAIIALSTILVVVLVGSFANSNKLTGTWILSKNQIGGGIKLEISKDTIIAKGSVQQYPGDMKFKYKIVNNSELILKYDWSFSNWPWKFSRATEIPLKYSIDKENGTLSLAWNGTDFVLLENNMDIDDMRALGWQYTPGVAWTSRVGTITFQEYVPSY